MIIDQPAIRPPADPSQRGEAMAFAAAAFLLSLVVRAPSLGFQSLWYDEVITANVAGSPWWTIVTERLGQGHFPTYFLLMKGLGLGGASDAMLRLPSAIFGSVAAALFSVIALRLGGRIASLASMLLFAFVPNLFFYGQEARPYALMLVFLAVATGAQLRILGQEGHPRRMAAWATVGSLGAALSIPAGIVSAALQHLSAFAAGANRLPPAWRRPFLRHVAITWIVIGLASLLLLPSVLRISGEAHGLMKWQLDMTASDRIAEAWKETYGFWVREDSNRYLPSGWELAPSLVFCALVVAGMVLGRRDRAIRYLAGSVIGTPLLFLVIGIFTATSGRYMIGMLPPAILLASCGTAGLLTRASLRLVLTPILATAALLLGLQVLDASSSHSRYDWRPLARFMKENDIRDVEILTNNSQSRIDMGRYLPDNGIVWRQARPPLQTIDRIWTWARKAEPAWLLLFYTGDTLPDDVVRGRAVCRWNFGYANLFVLARDPATLPAPLRGCAGT